MVKDIDYDQLLDIAPFGCVLMADDFTIQYINPILAKFLCVSNAENLVGSSFLQFVPEKYQNTFLSFIHEMNCAAETQTWKFLDLVDSKGKQREFLFSGTKKPSEFNVTNTFLLAGILLENDKPEDAFLRISGERLLDKSSYNIYQTLFDNAMVGIMIMDHDGVIGETNQNFADYFHLSKEALVNKHYSDVFKETAKDDFNKLQRMVGTAKTHDVKNIITIEPKNGEYKILEISLAKINSHCENEDLIMMIAEDITDEQGTHAALIQSEKLALTGRLAASLAHEINNPLQTSIGCLGLADEMLNDENKDLHVYINMAMEELQRSARIVKKLRDLNRRADPEDKELVDLHEILESVLVLTKNRIEDRDITLVYPSQKMPLVVLVSRDQIQQVLLNLVMNAIDALPKGGNIYLDLQHTRNPGGVRVKIRDTGVGMNRQVMKSIFDPFFTTKEEGLGLGLYICKKIIDDHKGRLTVESTPGEGTAFSIWLPGFEVGEFFEE